MIDWYNIVQKDAITGAPDWYSVIAVPVIKNNTIKGLLYVSVKAKEFEFEEFNFVDTLAKVIATIL